MAPSSKHKYELNDRILCNSTGLYYEAKIIEVTDTGYKIHYQGWHKRYDELVLFDDVDTKFKPFSNEALMEAKKGIQEAKKGKGGKKKSNRDEEIRKSEPGSRASTPSVSGSAKANSVVNDRAQSVKERSKSVKRKADDKLSHATAADSVQDQDMTDIKYVELSSELKQVLVDDHDLVNRQEKLYKLPCEYTVESIVKEYCTYLNESIDDTTEIIMEFDQEKCVKSTVSKFITSSQGVMDYFDSLLSFHLLYKFERLQYVEYFEKPKHEDTPKRRKTRDAPSEVPVEELVKKPSAVYGLPHLLRLLSRFDSYLKAANWTDSMTKMLGDTVADFVVFLSQNKDKYFNNKRDYQPATPEYKKQALL